MGCLVRVSGVVTRRSAVFPQLKICKYNCLNCGYVLGPYSVNGGPPPAASATSVRPLTLVRSPPQVVLQFDLIDVARPGEEIEVTGVYTTNFDSSLNRKSGFPVFSTMIEAVRKPPPISRPPALHLSLPSQNYVLRKEEQLSSRLLTDEDKKEILKLSKASLCHISPPSSRLSCRIHSKAATPAVQTFLPPKPCWGLSCLVPCPSNQPLPWPLQDPALSQRIISSIAPSIWGHDDIKTCIALSMFGGVGKDVNGKHRIRTRSPRSPDGCHGIAGGDINVLLLGDPGTAKSQFLKYIEKTAPRAVYTTGQGASAVGLTAAVRKDPATGEWTLEGGALVLADKGVCLIDEFDKMNDGDRTSIHEAMEQQSISISKAGIITTLQARCCVIAAANPIKGRYDSALSFAENVDLTQPILSRFDCICVVKDTVDPIADERLAEFVVESHRRSHPRAPAEESDSSEGEGGVSQGLLRKYLTYARQHVKPVLQDIDAAKIQRVYAELRQESSSGGVAVAVRHIESIIRMAEGSARMHLREYVSEADVDLAISVMLNSVIKSQKYALARQMEGKFAKYLVRKQDANELLLFKLRSLFHDAASLTALRRPADADPDAVPLLQVDVEEFESKAREMRVVDLDPFYKSDLFTGGKVRASPVHRPLMLARPQPHGSLRSQEPRHGFRKVMGESGWEVIVRASDLDDYEKAKQGASTQGDGEQPDADHSSPAESIGAMGHDMAEEDVAEDALSEDFAGGESYEVLEEDEIEGNFPEDELPEDELSSGMGGAETHEDNQ
ncbi:MAG: hypothetical protein SGPRY_006679 [Prymnesium sp.]